LIRPLTSRFARVRPARLAGLRPGLLPNFRDAAAPANPAPAVVDRVQKTLAIGLAAVLLAILLLWLNAATGHAAPVPPTPPATPSAPASPDTGSVNIAINGMDGKPSSAVLTLIGITLLSVAPALLLMMTSFTKIFVVLAMTRNALSLPSIPPNQVLAGLALFLSIFVMWPVLNEMNTVGVQPYLNGTIDFNSALSAGSGPLQHFMLAHTREEDIALMTRAAGMDNPATPEAVPLQTLIPAFMISELRAAFIIGFVIFIPFLVIDLVVSAALMSMGMMMLPPVMISLPFKILLFVLVDGWGLIITSLIQSYASTG
jgi:flagellar biosynthesis protein FliP